jgi:hypothetical protein
MLREQWEVNMKKKKSYNLTFIAVIVLCLGIILSLLYYSSREQIVKRELNKEGYTSSKEDAFYHQIISNNTLDDYYNDIASNKDSLYEEFYVSKESNSLIELKMYYQNQINTTLNILSKLNSDYVNFNFELSYQDSSFILEGNSSNNYECDVIEEKNVSKDSINYYCDYIKDEIENYLQKKYKLLQNETLVNNIK